MTNKDIFYYIDNPEKFRNFNLDITLNSRWIQETVRDHPQLLYYLPDELSPHEKSHILTDLSSGLPEKNVLELFELYKEIVSESSCFYRCDVIPNHYPIDFIGEYLVNRVLLKAEPIELLKSKIDKYFQYNNIKDISNIVGSIYVGLMTKLLASNPMSLIEKTLQKNNADNIWSTVHHIIPESYLDHKFDVYLSTYNVNFVPKLIFNDNDFEYWVLNTKKLTKDHLDIIFPDEKPQWFKDVSNTNYHFIKNQINSMSLLGVLGNLTWHQNTDNDMNDFSL